MAAVADKVVVVAASNGARSVDKTGSVADVANVAHAAGNGGEGRVCAQCGSGNGALDPHRDGNRWSGCTWIYANDLMNAHSVNRAPENIRNISMRGLDEITNDPARMGSSV